MVISVNFLHAEEIRVLLIFSGFCKYIIALIIPFGMCMLFVNKTQTYFPVLVLPNWQFFACVIFYRYFFI